jgi:hypothetical protein
VLGLPLLPLLLLLLPHRRQHLGPLLLQCRHKAVVQAAPADPQGSRNTLLSAVCTNTTSPQALSPCKHTLKRMHTHTHQARPHTCPAGHTQTPAPRGLA